MKSIKTTLAALLLTAALLPCVSCKKESAGPITKTTQEKLLGKWNWVSAVSNDYYGGMPHITTLNYLPGDYMEFKSDGTVISFQSGSTSTFTYSIIDGTKIWMVFPNYIYYLQVLTESELQLYIKIVTGSDYYESTLNLKR